MNDQSAFSITVDQATGTDNWYMDGVLSASGSKNISNTWTQAGLHNVTYSASNGSVSITWYVIVAAGSTSGVDLNLVALHFGEVTSAPYPDYDVNKDGIVNVFDAVLAAKMV